MGQLGLFDLATRYGGLDVKNDPLVKIDAVVVWGDFRADLEAVWRRPDEARTFSYTHLTLPTICSV